MERSIDELNRITNITHKGVDNSTLLGLSYTLDPTGRRTAITASTGRVSTYTQDTLCRLTGDNIVDPINGNHNATYEYDEVGNRIYETVNGVQTQYTIDNNDRLIQQGGTSYQYDDNGNTISETLDGITTTYTYDSRNRLIATDKGGAQIDMAYDPDGIRVQKVVDGEATDYLVDSNRAYAQVLVEQTGLEELGYTFGTDLVGLDTGSESYSYLNDALGSTRLLSDGNGLVADDVAYDAWGVRLAGGDVAENQYLYTGEQFDFELDSVYLRARYLNANAGRFTQMDSWLGRQLEPITSNKYVYGSSDAVNWVDPSGKFGLSGVLSGLSFASIAFSAYDLYGSYTEGQAIGPKEIGMTLILGRVGGGAKILKGFARKICGKKRDCKVPILDTEHLYFGHAKVGKVTGFHSTAETSILSGPGFPYVETVVKKNLVGAYKAKVKIRNHLNTGYKGKKSDMYPDYWSKG